MIIYVSYVYFNVYYTSKLSVHVRVHVDWTGGCRLCARLDAHVASIWRVVSANPLGIMTANIVSPILVKSQSDLHWLVSIPTRVLARAIFGPASRAVPARVLARAICGPASRAVPACVLARAVCGSCSWSCNWHLCYQGVHWRDFRTKSGLNANPHQSGFSKSMYSLWKIAKSWLRSAHYSKKAFTSHWKL